MTDTGPRLTSARIKAFEKKLSDDLPEDYRKFLLKVSSTDCARLVRFLFE